MTRIIRTATLYDLDAIAGVEAACFPPAEAATREQFEGRLEHYASHFWLMIETCACDNDNKTLTRDNPKQNERLIAFVDGLVTDEEDLTDYMYSHPEMHNESGKWQMIFGVNTLPEYRRRGIAGELITRAIHDAQEQQRLGLVLTCKAELVHWYAKFGFVSEGVSESVHGGVVWYQMRLTF